MSATINTILIIGATSGLGEQFARRFHALGKKVIVTGRRGDRLASLKSELGSNVESYQWDITDFTTVSSRAAQIITENPDTDSVFLASGIGSMLSFLDASSSTESGIIAECNTNVTAQMLLTRIFVPHLSSIAAKDKPAIFFLMGAGLGYVPVGFLPVYCGTKAAIHSLALSLRQEINKADNQNIKNNLSVVEVVAPFVDTEYAKAFKSPSGPQPMPVKEYIDETMAALAAMGQDGKPVKEAAAGSAKNRVELWRGSIGKHMKEIGLDC